MLILRGFEVFDGSIEVNEVWVGIKYLCLALD